MYFLAAMDITTDRLRKMHVHLLGGEPTTDQAALYDKFPENRGYNDTALNEERFTAVVVLTMSQAILQKDRVLLLAPLPHEKWVVGQFNGVADRIFAVCKKLPGSHEGRVKLARGYGEAFKRIFIFGRLLQLPEPPKWWASFGFAASDPVPEWVKTALVPV